MNTDSRLVTRSLLLSVAILFVGAALRGQYFEPQSALADEEQWYTCGMHPNVLQQGPGTCPICGMQLTPLKTDDASAEGAAGRERKVLYWRAPMNPNYMSEKPGKSPMGMDLVPVYADEAESASGHSVRIDPVTVQNMGIRTTVVSRGPLVRTIRTIGRVDYDEQLVTYIDTKFQGWIEKLHVDQTGQQVTKGQKLFEVYSPALYAAQEEYLAAARNLPRLSNSTFAAARTEAAALVDAALRKLRYLDISASQIARLKKSGKIEKTLNIYSPSNGAVTEKMALEGMYVKPGMRLYTIADLSKVWVYVDIYEYQLPWIKIGQRAVMQLPYIQGKQFEGKVVYIYPYLEERTRVVKVQLEFENPNLELRPGMFATVKLESRLKEDALLVPRMAYIDSGTRNLVFVDRGSGKFQPREITVGVESEDGMVQVLYGLDGGDRVVVSGQFLLDAESNLKEAVMKMIEAGKQKAKDGMRSEEFARHQHAAHGQTGSAHAAGIPSDAAFACPMQTHPSESSPEDRGPYFSAEPGECPRCGMELVPIENLAWTKALKEFGDGDSAYTCENHPHVFSKEPGECPLCKHALKSFKVMYTCPDPRHAHVISTESGRCPHCAKELVPYRGVWLDEEMAAENVPPKPGVAKAAPYHCPIHPLVHSDKGGSCPICARPLEKLEADSSAVSGSESSEGYVCPMHPDQQGAAGDTCSVCGMRLVKQSAVPKPMVLSDRVARQVNHIAEHYLALQERFSRDSYKDAALHAAGLHWAAKELSRLMPAGQKPETDLVPVLETLMKVSLEMTKQDLAASRVSFVELSSAVQSLFKHLRPDKSRWPKLYSFHCPMSNGGWVQTTKETANPYYGASMLSCGSLVEVQ